MERLYEATIRLVITEQTVRMRIASCQTSYLLAHTFHFNTDSLHLDCAALVKGERYQRRHRAPATPVRPSSPFTFTVNEPNDVCLRDCISQYAVQYGF